MGGSAGRWRVASGGSGFGGAGAAPESGVCSVSAAVMLPLECFVTGERAAALLCLSPPTPTQTLRLLFLPPDFSRPVSPVRGNVPRVPPSAYLWNISQHLLTVAAPLRSKEKKRVTLLQSDGCNLSNSASPNCQWHQNVFLVFSLWMKVTVE